MAKPMLVTLPFVLLLLDVWPLGRWAADSRPPGRSPAAIRARLVIEKLPLLALSSIAAVATVIVQARAGAMGGLGELPVYYRVSNALVSCAAYSA